MSLPVPTLDDRHFQDLVDDAKRLVQRRCPEWTDHNVSDPGITLIETFAWMTDQLIYRLNRVPERTYVKFLELIGVRLFPPCAATCPQTFWLSAPPASVITIPAGTEVATVRTETEPAIVFATVEPLEIIPCSMTQAGAITAGQEFTDYAERLANGSEFFCFDNVPQAGDTMLVGLSDAVPSCAITLRIGCRIEGIGVDPTNPPLVWEAWAGGDWARCTVDSDGTGGLNRDGDIVLHIPHSHITSVMGGRRAGWLRARVTETEEGQPRYERSPRIQRLSAFTVGGTVAVVHARAIEDEVVGESHGVAGQRFALRHQPVVAEDEPAVLGVSSAAGWEIWSQVSDFAESAAGDHHFTLDPVAGEIEFGPAVREADGSVRQFGAVPPKGATLRLRRYRTGGGRQGNVTLGALSVLKSSIPYIARVENRAAAAGGVDAEDLDNAKVRGPIMLRSRNRAVTAADHEALAREAAPEAARLRCVPAGEGAGPSDVRILVVPTVSLGEGGRLRFEQLIPAESTLRAIATHLDERRLVGARVAVHPPIYQGITVVARLRARTPAAARTLQDEALDTLYGYLHPLVGGPDRRGWPFGRPVNIGDVYAVLQQLPGLGYVEDARLFAADPITGQRGQPSQRVDLDANALVFSFEHQVVVADG